MKLFTTILCAMLLVAIGSTARADGPMNAIKSVTEQVVNLLKDPKVQGDSKKGERQQLVRDAMEKRFDWDQSARACLGRHWTKRTPAEKEEFIKLFSQFLKDTYSEKIVTYFSDLDKIEYQGEKILEGNYASVKLTISTKAKVDHPVEYRMEKSASGDDWRVYDVVIEGVSLVKNYRDQFDAIITKSSYEALIKDLKARQLAKP